MPKSTRRSFLRAAGLTLATAGIAPPLRPASESAPARRERLRSMRPRPATGGLVPPEIGLFFDAEELPGLRDRFADTALFTSLRERLESIDRTAMRETIRNEIRFNDHLYDIVTVHDLARDMALLFAMTGDEDAAALSVEAVRSLMRFPRWDYFLEAGEHVIGLQRAPGTTLAVAFAIDWLGNAVDEEERRTWARAMGERGCDPSYLSLYGMRHPDRVEGWSMDPTSTFFEHRPGDRFDLSNWPVILDETNLKAIPAAALAIGALTCRHALGPSDDIDRWLNQALFSLRSFGDLYTDDGSYPEGVSYANYTSNHLVLATDALLRVGAADLSDVINWIGYGEFLRETSLPTADDPHGIVNFGDAGQGAVSSVPFWTAARTGDGRCQWFGETAARAHDEFSLFWYDPDVPSEAPPDLPHLWLSDLDWAVARTGYDPSDLVVAMRGGGPANHEHADRNSIIVKAFGEILVADPYRPPYSNSDPAWMLRTTAGHSALLIDGNGHQYHQGEEGTNPSQASAEIVRSREADGWTYWTSAATPAYRLVLPDVRSVTRTVLVLYHVPAIVVADRVVKENDPSIIQARFFAANQDGQTRLTAYQEGFVTRRPGAVLTGRCTSDSDATIRAGTLPIPEETAVLHPFVDVSTERASTAPALTSVLVPTDASAPPPQVRLGRSEAGVTHIRVSASGRAAECRIFEDEAMPEIDVELS